MTYRISRPLIDRAMEDLKERTLAPLNCEMAKLIHLSSTRDYNTGHYYHDGLESQYTPEVTEAALKSSHSEIFRQVAVAPLEFLVDDLQTYFQLAHPDETVVLESWKGLQPYKVVVPHDSDPLLRELFFFNIKAALIILENRQRTNLRVEQSSSPRL